MNINGNAPPITTKEISSRSVDSGSGSKRDTYGNSTVKADNSEKSAYKVNISNTVKTKLTSFAEAERATRDTSEMIVNNPKVAVNAQGNFNSETVQKIFYEIQA